MDIGLKKNQFNEILRLNFLPILPVLFYSPITLTFSQVTLNKSYYPAYQFLPKLFF